MVLWKPKSQKAKDIVLSNPADALGIEEIAKNAAAYISKSWYLHPDFAPFSYYEGVNLGECVQGFLYPELVRVFRSKLFLEKLSRYEDIIQQGINEYIKDTNLAYLPSFPVKPRDHTAEDSGTKPDILVSVRTQNMAVVKALSESGYFNIIVEGHMQTISASLKKAGIIYESFEDFMTPDVRSRAEEAMNRYYPVWNKAITKPAFVNQFYADDESLKDDIIGLLDSALTSGFSQIIFYIETFKSIEEKRDIRLLMLWNDCIGVHRALALHARVYDIPSLHVAHAIHGLDPSNETIYTDRIALYGSHMKDLYVARGNPPQQILITGNPDWDKYSRLPALLDRDRVCRMLGLDPAKKTILFASFFAFASLCSTDSAVVETFFRSLVRALVNLQKQHGVQLVVKLHPAEYDNKAWYQKIALEEGQQGIYIETSHLEELLFACDVMICRGSNIGFEALMLDKPVISYALPLYDEKELVSIVKKPEELEEVIAKKLFEPDVADAAFLKRKQDVLSRYNYMADGMATQRVIEIIESMTQVKIKLPEDFVPFVLTGLGYSQEGEDCDLLSSLMSKAGILMAKDEPVPAVTIYKDAIELFPGSIRPLMALAKAYLSLARFDDALDILDILFKNQPDIVEGKLVLSLVFYHKKMYHDALSSLESIFDMPCSKEEKGLAFFYAADCARAMGKTDEAISYYNRSLELMPDSKNTLNELGLLYFQSAKYDMAIKVFEKLVEKYPENEETLNDFGVVLLQAGEKEKARYYIKRALLANPEYAEAIHNLASLEAADKQI